MAALILIILALSAGVCGNISQSLQFHISVISSPGFGVPVFSEVGYIDDQEVTNYNSDTRQDLPKTEWMKKLEPEYWEEVTKEYHKSEEFYKDKLRIITDQFNHTGGIHILQVICICELRDDGSTAGYEWYGYDGKYMMYLDKQSAIFIPTNTQEVQSIARRWNSEGEGERVKNFLQNICIEWLKKYLDCGREDLEKRVQPEVKVWGRRDPDGVTRLQCLAYGFYPRPVDVRWMKNGVDHVPSDEMSPTLPHPDGTYQIRVSVEVPTPEEDSYACYVEHSSLRNETLIVKWESKDFTPIIIGGVAAAIVVIIAFMIGVFIYQRYSG